MGGDPPEVDAVVDRRILAVMDIRALESVSLSDADGQVYRLGDVWAEKPVIVVFLRHFG